MSVMTKHKTITWMWIDVVREVILWVLDHGYIIVGIIEGVKVIINHMVPKAPKSAEAGGIAIDIWWPEIGRYYAQDIAKGHFIVNELILEIGGREIV